MTDFEKFLSLWAEWEFSFPSSIVFLLILLVTGLILLFACWGMPRAERKGYIVPFFFAAYTGLFVDHFTRWGIEVFFLMYGIAFFFLHFRIRR